MRRETTMNYIELPKIELHAHLTGSISRRTLHEVWLRKKETGDTDLEDPLIVMPEGKHDYNLQTFFPLFSSYIYNLIIDEKSVRYTTEAVLNDFLSDGVCYLELRTTPRKTPQLSVEQYISTLVHTISSFESQNPQLHTRLILAVDRRHTTEQAASILELALKYRDQGVVGLDLCGDPTARPAGQISVFTPVFTEAKKKGLGITVHFAEAEASGSKEELDTLLSWEPGRLGHVIWEDEETKKEISKRELCLELCLSCNVRAGMVLGGFEGHHFGHWRGVKGPKISLSTDDVGVFGSPLSNEYRLVAQHFGLDRKAICELARQPIDGIFGGEQEKERLRHIMWSS
ncbi:adenosine deaminase [Fusarium beomiforme]|uniref:Adenosine deaminase n=1 Tax=Fusarium beomiforme TaxID=44412 RepID=A0A9P5ALR5_9HYPO|nr:adenosine deaminase [Fusarium beomiforme]